MSIKEFTKSDELNILREFFSDDGVFSKYGNIFQLDIIVDANIVLKDLRWFVCKAKNKFARTDLIESIDAGTVIAYAPTYLEVEILKNIPLISEQENVDPDLLFEKWENLRQKINFIDSGGAEDNPIDPKDVPYLKLHKSTGYPVLTKDPHLEKMGARVISIQVVTSARNYSREAAVEYKVKAGALGVFVLTPVMVKTAMQLAASVWHSLEKLPPWVWLILIAGIMYFISDEQGEKHLKSWLSSLPEKARDYAKSLLEGITPMVVEYQDSHKSSTDALGVIERELNSDL